MSGEEKPFLSAPYTWKTYGDMNVGFWEKHQNTSLDDAKTMLGKSHTEVMKLAEAFENDELFSKNVYKWVGGSTLGSYFVSVTASHYDWAMKKLKAFLPRSNRAKYCEDCAKEVHRKQKAASERKRRSGVDK